ncbi:ABC transporter permease [Tessaracoccus oleiagri]|uniref:Transport permease protein n=1 Tax=Tessaracoccus oleiagri TaxID=686624 RepID=A0A1G9N0G9_9ACTN|nr:ABC transporter permease [Tessaracoccus oleiagri]SDL80022.1 lipooligosaccharide transport system permease protein [Tessaracoccus oleiagri]
MSVEAPKVHSGFLRGLYAGNTMAVLERGLKVIARNNWLIILTGFFEPVLYLLSMGLGLGALVGAVEFYGIKVPYAAYIAPALMAVSAMNGAVYDSTMNVFFKMKHAKLYDQMLSTSLGPMDVALGEILIAMFRGLLYAVGFMIITTLLGLNLSWTALLAVPAALLIAFGFAAIGLGVTSYMKTYQHLDFVYFVMLPMFLLSATFFPISVYPEPVQWFIMALPLWHGVDMIRQLTTGLVQPSMWGHVTYFVVMIAIGATLATSRLKALFLR